MRNSIIIFRKQLLETFKNPAILIQFILFPLMTFIMENAISFEEMQPLFFTKMFSAMYIGMAPITSVCSIISEEKEKNTLRVLLLANVKPYQYLFGIGAYVWVFCMIGAFAMSIGFESRLIPIYMLIMSFGFTLSIIFGAFIGVIAKNQITATSLLMPVMMIISFVPLLSSFNEKIAGFGKYLYTEQLSRWLNVLSFADVETQSYIIIFVNVVVLLIMFTIAYRKKGLD